MTATLAKHGPWLWRAIVVKNDEPFWTSGNTATRNGALTHLRAECKRRRWFIRPMPGGREFEIVEGVP